MKIQIIKNATLKTKKQGMCDILVDEPPVDKR